MKNLVGVAGRAESGKDLVGKIIQYLVYTKDNRMSFSSYCLIDSPNSGWCIKKFSAKLKEIASLLTGIQQEKFEDQEFKKKEMPEQWWFYQDKVHKHIIYNYSSFKDLEVVNHGSIELIKPTYRWFLQALGTDAIRNGLHPNTWVNALFAEYENNISGYQSTDGKLVVGTKELSLPFLNKDKRYFPHWIITDVRFPNEFNAIKERNGIVIRVNRPKIESIVDKIRSYSNLVHYNIPLEHESETALDNAVFDYIIENDSTIEALIEKIKIILQKENII